MQRYFAVKKDHNQAILAESDYYHIKTVMRMQEGSAIEVVYEQVLYLAVVHFDQADITIEIRKQLMSAVKESEIILVLPLLKEQKMDFVLQKSTELGVTRIIPVTMERSIVRLEKEREMKKWERWNRICKEASEQSKRLTVPVVEPIQSLAVIGQLSGVKMVCSTTEKQNNLRLFLQKQRKCAKMNIVVGPEGGFSPQEEQLLRDLGCELITLGSRILRVETVPIFLLSVLNYELME